MQARAADRREGGSRRRKTSRLLRAVVLLGGTVLAGTGKSNAADKHPFGIDDYSELHSARAVAVSPDGKTILYNVSTDGTKGATKHEWRLIDVNGENSHKLELPEKFEPRGFTPDGALYGTYEVDKLGQLAIVPLAAAKPTIIMALPNGAHGATISPDGRRFAILADSRAKDPLEGVHTVVDNDQTSLYVVGADGGGGAWWCPDLNVITDIAWSKDSAEIAVMTQTPKIGFHELHSFVNICGARGSRRLAQIPDGTSGMAWSDDGEEIVFAATTTATLTPEQVWTVPFEGGPPADRSPQPAGTATTVTADPRGTVWVEMHKGVITEADTFRRGKLETMYRWPGGVVEGLPVFPAFSASPDVLAFSVEDQQHTTNVAVTSGTELRTITHEG